MANLRASAVRKLEYMNGTKSEPRWQVENWLKLASLVLFGVIALALGLTIAWFNGVDLWLWPEPPQSNYQKAVAEFKIAIDLEPGNPEGYRWLSKAYVLAGQKEDAEAVFQQAIENNPGKAWSVADLGQFYLDQDQLEDAVTQFQQAIELEPDYGPAYTGLAQAYQQQGQNLDPEALIALYQKVVEANSAVAWPYLSLGDAYLSLGNVADAEAAYQKAVEAEPTNVQLYEKLGEIYRWNLNKLDQAISYYRQATQLSPENGWSHAALGWALYAADQPAQGQQELDIALQLSPEESIIQRIVGEAMLQYQSAEQAIPYFVKAIQIDPANAEAHLGLARAYRQQGDFDLALQHAEQTVTLSQNPDSTGAAHLEQGYIYFAQQNTDAAVAQFSLALNAAPNNPWYQVQVGNFYLNDMHQPETAAANFRRAIELAPYNYWYQVYLSQALFAGAQPEEAFNALDKALALAEDDAPVYLNVGQFVAGLAQWDTVAATYEQAIAQGIGDNVEIYQGLGDAYRQLNDLDKALANYRYAAKLSSSPVNKQ